MNGIIGVDLGGTKLLLIAERGRERTIETSATGAEFTPSTLVDAIRDFRRRVAPAAQRIGIALPGVVDAGGTVTACDIPPRFVGWNGAEALRTDFEHVAVMNDVVAALEEEAFHSPSKDCLAIVLVGTGIGAAFRVNGQNVRGASGSAGELGCMPLRTTDGAIVTLDSRASGAAIVRTTGLTGAEVAERADSGDGTVLEAIREAGEWMGLGLATFIDIVNPAELVFDGGAIRLRGYREAALRVAEKAALPQAWAACRIRPSSAGELTVALGTMRAVMRSPSC